MTDPDRNRQREHWQAIAEQLGLAPESEQPCAPEVEPSVAAPPAPAEDQVDQAPAAAPVEHSEEPPPRRGRRGRSARADERTAQREEANPPPAERLGALDADAEPSRSADEGPERGRRRRSARNLAATESKAADSEAVARDAAAREETARAERPKRRGRGRRRQTTAEADEGGRESAVEQEPSAKDAPSDAAEEAELEDVRSLSDWNVPSWNELIASLYRPER